MITDALIAFVRVIVAGMFPLLPVLTWAGPVMGSSVATFMSDLWRWNHFAPVSELVVLGSFNTVVFSTVFGFKWFIKIIDWIADVIP
jgi:predicted membrane protein